MRDGFIRCAVASPALRVADCAYNAEQIVSAMRRAAADGVQLLCLPELWPDRLHLRGSVFAAAAAARGRGGPARRAGRQRRVEPCHAGRVAGAGGRQAVQTARRSVCGGRLLGLVPQDPPAQLRRILRNAALCPRPDAAPCRSRWPGRRRCWAPTSCLPAHRCRSLCWAWRSAKTCGRLCRPAARTRWPGPPWWRTFRPATRPWARQSTAGRLWPGRARGCCAAISMPTPATAKARPT